MCQPVWQIGYQIHDFPRAPRTLHASLSSFIAAKITYAGQKAPIESLAQNLPCQFITWPALRKNSDAASRHYNKETNYLALVFIAAKNPSTGDQQ